MSDPARPLNETVVQFVIRPPLDESRWTALQSAAVIAGAISGHINPPTDAALLAHRAQLSEALQAYGKHRLDCKGGRVVEPVTCPQCGETMTAVRNTSAYLNNDQFDAVKAGDWFCKRHYDAAVYVWDSALPKHGCTCGFDAVLASGEGRVQPHEEEKGVGSCGSGESLSPPRSRVAEPSPYDRVTRFEVIDETGRAYTRYGVGIELSLQDDGGTLKVFVTKWRTVDAESQPTGFGRSNWEAGRGGK